MSLENEEKITTKLKNTVTDDDIEITTTIEDAKKLKELLEQQNAQNNEIFKENARLKEEKLRNPATYGALLNEQQITGQTLPLDQNDTSLPVDMQSFSDEYSLVSSLEQQADKGSLEAKKALSQLYSKATEKSWAYDYEGDPKDLYKKLPKNATEKERQELNDKRRLWTRVK